MNVVTSILNRTFKLAPGVELADPSTWIEQSTFGPKDYPDGMYLPDWERARANPREPQLIRPYLIIPTPNQTREARQTLGMNNLIENVAIKKRDGELGSGIDKNLLVRPGPQDTQNSVYVTGGHRRLFAGVNAGMYLFYCQLDPYCTDAMAAQAAIIDDNEYHRPPTPIERIRSYISYLHLLSEEVQRQEGRELTFDEAVSVVTSKWDISRDEVWDLLLSLVWIQRFRLQ